MSTRFILAGVTTLVFAAATNDLLAQANPEPTPDEDPTGHTGVLKGNVQTGCGYNSHNGNGVRSVMDLHISGLGDYGLDFTRHWNSLPPGNEPQWPAAMSFSDFGTSGWSHSWSWAADYAEDYPKEVRGCDCNDNTYTTSITITFPDGHVIKYKLVRFGPTQFGPGDPRFGPPYSPAELLLWSAPPAGVVHDNLGDMAADGSNFWLYLADGGSVHFTGGPGGYQATEVFDPHGLKTTLTYNNVNTGQLERVEQEGGRWLTITWGYLINGSVAPVIKRVETGGFAGSQAVEYTYLITGSVLTLRTVEYGENSRATYTYNNALLMEADDPRFAGPMTHIRYKYRLDRCILHPASDPPDAHFYYIYAQPEAITEEQSPYDDPPGIPIAVSRFAINCWNGTRTEWNGLGGWRKFYYGKAATWPGSGAQGHALAKVTDFTYTGDNVPSERQNYLNGEPYQTWDGRNIETLSLHQDGSGLPSEIRHTGSDGSSYKFDRIDPNNTSQSDPPDLARVRNPYHHWLFHKTDERNLTTTYRRDSRRRVVDITYPDTSSEHYTYNDWNQVVTHTLPSNSPQQPAVVTYEYDPTTHRLLREYNSVDGWDARKEYIYDDAIHPDLVHKVIDGRARSSGAPYSTRMEYDGSNRVIEVHYAPTPGSADPHVTYGYDTYGNCTSITDEMGHIRTYTYDSYRRCISYTEPLDAPGWNGAGTVASRTWEWDYDRDIEGWGQRGASTHTSKEWRLQKEPVFNAAGQRRMTARIHDVNNRLKVEMTGLIMTSATTWDYGLDGETHYFTYDENGQKSTYTDPRGRLTTYDYDLRNRLWKTNETVNTLPRTTEILYDTTGNKTLVKFPVELSGQRTQQWLDYDGFGQPGRFIDERGNTTNLTYWWGPMKKLRTVTTHRDRDGGGAEDQPTTFSYDQMGRLLQTLFPDGSYENTTYECGDGVSYNCDQVHTYRTRKGAVKTIQYDARGREISHSWSDGTPGITSTWDDANRRLSLTNSFSAIDYQYDAAAQPLYEGNSIAGSGGRMQTTFYRYPDGDLANMVYPAGPWVRHDYTARGQLKTAGVADGSGNWAFQLINYHYLEDGKVEHQDYGNGVRSDMQYDGRGFTSYTHSYKTGNYQSYADRTYYRDNRDRIWAFQKGWDAAANPKENGRGDRFFYDGEGQLTQAYYECADPTGSFNSWRDGDVFTYDALGNRSGGSWVSSIGSVNWSRRDNGLNQYSNWTPSVINYDDNYYNAPGNGVLMQEGTITASYNALNQPIAIWSPAYSGTSNFMWFGYDPLGRCVKRWVSPSSNFFLGATYMYYDGWSIIQEGDNIWSPTRLYVQGNRVDELEVTFNVVTSQYGFHHYDARGHCILTTDIGGNMMEEYDYDAWGKPHFYSGTSWWSWDLGYSEFGNRFLFTGREWLSDLGVYDYRARLYHPELGRFLQPDPKEFAAGDYNLYRYCHNDPINKADPMGLETLTRPEIDEQVGDRVVQASQFIGHQIAEMYREDPVGFIILVATMGRAPEGEGIRLPGLSGPKTEYVPRTFEGSRVPNRLTDMSRSTFEKNLSNSGFTKSMSKDGKATNYEKDGARYSVREGSKSTGGPTAEYFKAGNDKPVLKIRLKKDGSE